MSDRFASQDSYLMEQMMMMTFLEFQQKESEVLAAHCLVNQLRIKLDHCCKIVFQWFLPGDYFHIKFESFGIYTMSIQCNPDKTVSTRFWYDPTENSTSQYPVSDTTQFYRNEKETHTFSPDEISE